MKATIVITSINDCTKLVNGYLANIAKYGHEANIILIPDLKTPELYLPSCVQIPSLYEQVKFLEKIGLPPHEVPVHSDNRRNVGYLMALKQGADVVISVDDDNWCLESDFVGQHFRMDGSVRTSTSGWTSNCPPHFPRGYPHFARNQTWYQSSGDAIVGRVAINAGLWTGDPDINATDWLGGRIRTCNLETFLLSDDVWCPINSQNTAVRREAMAAYYYIRMDAPMDRYGDIFQGYFALKCCKHLGSTARFGTPVVDHRRNAHNYLKDAQAEIPAMILLEELLPKLVELKLTGSTFSEAYLCLADFIEYQGGDFYTKTARRMRLWTSACKEIGL